MLPQLLIVSIELPKLIRQDISVRHKVEVVLAVLLLQTDHVAAESVFAGDLVALRKVVDLLVLI
jgi:hypothetical protein